MKLLRTIALALTLIVSGKLSAQQEVMYTQYMFNGLALNPAYAGSHEVTSLSALYRTQWLNIDGAPVTSTFSAHSRIPNQPIGAGLMIVSDQISIFRTTNIYASGSYYIPFQDGKLQFGLQAGIVNLSSDFTKLTPDNASDPNLGTGVVKGLKPNFGGGAYYYDDVNYLGISVPRLMNNTFSNGAQQTQQFKRHYFITGGRVMDINENFKIKPSFLIKAVSGAPIQLDLNANVLFIEKVWAGLSWRSFDSFDLLFQYYINEQFSIGYSLDITSSKLSSASGTSHEFMLNYQFSFTKDKVLSPRYF